MTIKVAFSNDCKREKNAYIDRNNRDHLDLLNENKFCLLTFYLLLSIVCSKLVYGNRKSIIDQAGKVRALTKMDVHSDILVRMQTAFWSFCSTMIEMNWLLVPMLVGIVTILFTWHIIYLDSKIPGVLPPSPFTPKKRWMQYRGRYNMSYALGVYVGIIVFLVLLFMWNKVFL